MIFLHFLGDFSFTGSISPMVFRELVSRSLKSRQQKSLLARSEQAFYRIVSDRVRKFSAKQREKLGFPSQKLVSPMQCRYRHDCIANLSLTDKNASTRDLRTIIYTSRYSVFSIIFNYNHFDRR